MNGVLLINKEKDFTSFDVVAVVRRLISQKKVGHTGTLDPNATGVLPVLLGTATKAQDIIPASDKKYRASFEFGIATDTLDIWGEVIETKPADVTKEDVLSALDYFRGKIEQLPPMYSAVSVGGKRLYQYAREGKEVERKPRKVTVYSIELESYDESSHRGTLLIHCSKGTYVRTIIDDLAKKLGTVGVMTDLCRFEACGFTLENCVTLTQLREFIENGSSEAVREAPFFKSVESLFSSYDEITVTEKQANRFTNGNPLDLTRLRIADPEDKKIYRVRDRNGSFLSLGIIDISLQSLKLYKHF